MDPWPGPRSGGRATGLREERRVDPDAAQVAGWRMAAWAAASRATGTRYGLQLT
jgi:hypothetical protein